VTSPIIRVSGLTVGDWIVPSTRFRLFDLLPLLRTRDIIVDVCLPGGRRVGEALALGGAIARADVVLVQKRLIPSWVVRILRSRRVPLVYDFDDAIWVAPDGSPTPAQDRARLEALIAGSSAVIAGNRYLSAWAERLRDEVTVIPTTLDTGVWRPLSHRQPNLTLGWVGTGGNLRHLESILPAVDHVLAAHPDVRLVVVSDTSPAAVANRDRVQFRRWDLRSQVADLADIDIGLMPLPDTPWTRGKCGFKALQFMALGAPVVVSPVGVNAEIVADGTNGLLALSEDDWVGALDRLIRDAGLRTRLGKAARNTVVKAYDIGRAADALASVLRSVRDHARAT